eukprot:CAMPEP_0183525532 /NCGR_PEP_ID=MMETSP0371-20130417/20712_1 /TAXON_ID=268820 /ORGANISM="Peridinium aciculiferum, Strain PAER-2" /LENGTH=61 /DNA_ID=CAMNT_0025724783 /DNA_START=47 /DNA_END=229 /DNA_ORIENTATION=-
MAKSAVDGPGATGICRAHMGPTTSSTQETLALMLALLLVCRCGVGQVKNPRQHKDMCRPMD